MQRTLNDFTRAWPAALLVLVGLAVYANGLSGPFIFGDQESIVANAHILHLQALGAAFSAPPDTPGAGRPIVSLSFAVNYWPEVRLRVR